MSTSEIILTWVLIFFRFVFIIVSVVSPVILLSALIHSIFKQRHKRVYLCMFGILLSFAFIYLVFCDFTVPARVDITSIKNNKDTILSINSGEYEFDTGYIVGEMIVYDEKEFELYEPTTETSKVYDIDDTTICAISPVFCDKDDRVSHAFEPTISSGTILIENNKKLIEISYYYDYMNVVSLVWPITNPELLYRPEIDIVDILETYTILEWDE